MKEYFKITYLAPASLIIAMIGYLFTLKSSVPAAKAAHAFFEAAMIGGLADWFAVVALFRHPLNLPIPHTSIIKKNRRKITGRIVEMLQTQWLTKEAILKKLDSYDFSEGVSDIFLSNGENELKSFFSFLIDEFIKNHIDAGSNTAGSNVKADTHISGRGGEIDFTVFARSFEKEIADVDFMTPLSGALNANIDFFRLIVINEIGTWLLMPDTSFVLREKLKKIIISYAQKYEMIKTAVEFGEAIGVLNYDTLTQELIKLLGTELEAARAGEAPEFNAGLDHAIKNIITGLKTDSPVREFPALMLRYAADKINIGCVIGKIIAGNKTAVMDYMLNMARTTAENLKKDEAVKSKFNLWLKSKISAFINVNHSQIGDIVKNNIDSVNDDELVNQIEEKVGDDLQYIRLNGAIIGGLVGLLIYFLKNYI